MSVPRAVAPGGVIVVRASRVSPGARVVFERRRAGGGWRFAGRRVARAGGRAALAQRVPVARVGSYTYRVRVAGLRSRVRSVRVRYVTFAAVGDVNFGNGPGRRIATLGPKWPWSAGAGRHLRAADISSANIECAVSVRGAPVQKKFRFRGRPSSLRAARTEAGLDIAVLGNNHVGDYGTRALGDTIRLTRRYGMLPVGAGADLQRAIDPVVVRRFGLRVAVVSFSEILPAFFWAGPRSPGTAFASEANIRAGIGKARRAGDVVIVQFHWGDERTFRPIGRQTRLAAIAFRHGADAVIGHHPHTLQPIRRLSGRRLVAWSLGNFIFGAASAGTASTGILTLRLSGAGVEGSSFRRGRIVDTRPVFR